MKFLLLSLLLGVTLSNGEYYPLMTGVPYGEFQTQEELDLVRRNVELHKARNHLEEEYRMVKLKRATMFTEKDEKEVMRETLEVAKVLEKIQVEADKLDADIETYFKTH
jgi:hypothetical protein